MPELALVVGLGNPGDRYVGTRHNVGFEVLDALVRRLASDPARPTRIDRLDCRALTGRVRIGSTPVLLAKPQTYMNLSGESVKGLLVKHFEEMAAIADATGICKNTYNNMEVLDWDETAEFLQAATGWLLTGEEVRRIGERIVNLERAFNAREGIARKSDTLPARFLREPLPPDNPSAGAAVDLDSMLDEYSRARGWDVKTGLPTADKLRELGLDTPCTS